jgi:hypothetical protein
VSVEELLGRYGDEDFGNDENTSFESEHGEKGNHKRFIEAIDTLEFDPDFQEEEKNAGSIADDDSMADEDEGYAAQTPAIAAKVPRQTTATSLASYRRNGPFGKLHSIGVLFRNSSQLNKAFRDAQRETNPSGQQSLAWVHNVATRWSSDYAMAERALLLRPALQRLFVNIEVQWINDGRNHHQQPEILSYMLTDSEWEVVKCLQRILKRFAIAIDQLQGDASTSQHNTGRFDEYFPVVECRLMTYRSLRHRWPVLHTP